MHWDGGLTETLPRWTAWTLAVIPLGPAHAVRLASGIQTGLPTYVVSRILWIFVFSCIRAVQVILAPGFIAPICLLLGDSLTTSERASCIKIAGRSYNTFNTGINGVDAGITGANLLDIAIIGIDLGLLTGDLAMVADAYTHIHGEVTLKHGIKADGIRGDGSFGQHAGLLYNGNYGKD